MKRSWVVLVPLGILAVAGFALIGGGLVQLLWNWLIPSLFGGPVLGFWQALGLLTLCGILFGGWSSQRSGGSRLGHRLEERFKHMTPEERERLRLGLRRGHTAPASDPEPGAAPPSP